MTLRIMHAVGKCRAVALILGIGLALFSNAFAAQQSDAGNAIRDILNRAAAPDFDVRSFDLPKLRAFYERRAFAPAWSGSPEAENASRTLFAALVHAEDEGLDPADYHLGASVFHKVPESALATAEFDILLSDAALRYAGELRKGRYALRSLDRDIDLPDQSFDAVAALSSALQSGRLPAFLTGLPPPHPQYARLKSALGLYRSIAEKGNWPSLPDRSSSAFFDNANDRDLLLRRLSYEDTSLATAGEKDVAEALKRFQSRHGLEPDGRVDAQTLEALNVPAAERVFEIVANMERWRWLPRAFEKRYVLINAADASLEVVDDGNVVLSSRVIVGRPRDPTPILRAVATGITVNPPWNVPQRIARNEILPKLKRHHNYLLSQNMILRNGPTGDPYGLNIDWRNVGRGAFRYRVQQLPGPKNALGTIKLELPNRFDVYLHDTPAKSVFDRDKRDVSHGCVRVQQILPLASYALTGDAASVSLLTSAVAMGTTGHFSLSEPLPIYFLYWTVFVDSDGSVEFRPDIYGRDRRLIEALNGRFRNERVTSVQAGCLPV